MIAGEPASDEIMALSVAQQILKSKRTVVFFHTWTVTKELLAQAIREKRSMDLDVCVDDTGNAYLGHSKEYHEKTREPFCLGSAGNGKATFSVSVDSAPAGRDYCSS